MPNRLLLIWVLLFIYATVTVAQDAFFMNTNQSLVYLNPSFSGSAGQFRNQAAYRNQWPNLSGTYVTYMYCTDTYIKPFQGGISLMFSSDDQARGTLRQDQISLNYAQYINFKDSLLKIMPSIGISRISRILDRGRLNYGDILDARHKIIWKKPGTVPLKQLEYYDMQASLLVKYADIYLGLAFHNITQPNISLMPSEPYNIPLRTTLHGSYLFKTSHKLNIHSFFRLTLQNNYNLYQLRMLFVHKYFFYGASYSSNTNLGIYAGIQTKLLGLSYCYDINTSKLMGNRAASHEIALSLLFRKKQTIVFEER